MKNYMWIFTLMSISVINASNVYDENIKNKPTIVDLFEDSLKSQSWTKHEEPCLKTMLMILDNAKNSTLWSMWFVDTLEIPNSLLSGKKYHLSNYDQCLSPEMGFIPHHEMPENQYCVVNVTLTEGEEMVPPADYILENGDVPLDVYLKKPSRHGLTFSYLQWGVCIPKICHVSSAAKIAKSLFQISHLGILGNTTIQTIHCENSASLSKLPTLGYVFLYLLLLLTITTMFCSWLTSYGRSQVGSFGDKFIKAFSLDRNMNSLQKVNEEKIHCLYFIRTITCYLVILLHHSIITADKYTNALEFDRVLGVLGYGMTHMDLIVDTFLAMSGLLLIRGLYNDKSQNPMKILCILYIRLLGVLGITSLYLGTTALYVNSGPMWVTVYGPLVKSCTNHWLRNVLMLSNVGNVENMCNFTSWYVSCDYQLCVVLSIWFVIYKKNKTIGKYALAVLFALSLILPGVATYVNHYSATCFRGVKSVADLPSNAVVNATYMKFYYRAGPFIVGAFMGHIMCTYKPQKYRKVIGTVSSHVAIIVGLILMAVVNVLGHYFYTVDQPMNTAIFVATDRSIWGIGVITIIGVSEYGDVPILNRISRWSFWVPLSRLTYGVYLTHILIYFNKFYAMRTPHTFSVLSTVVDSIGVTVIAFIASLYIWLVVEAPLINIINLLMDIMWKSETLKYNVSAYKTENSNGKQYGEDQRNGRISKEEKTNGKAYNGEAYNGNDHNGKAHNGNVYNGKTNNGINSNGKIWQEEKANGVNGKKAD